MVGKYKVITLCGSTRFKDAFLEAQKRLGSQIWMNGLFPRRRAAFRARRRGGGKFTLL